MGEGKPGHPEGMIRWSWEVTDVKGAVCVVSDVLAATTNIARMLTQGAGKLVLVTDENVGPVRRLMNDAVMAGESRHLPRDFFHVSNHPREIFRYDFRNRQVVYMSNNGTRVIADAFRKGAQEVIAVSFVNISAVSAYLKTRKDGRLVLIASGEGTYDDPHAPEDLGCITALDRVLQGRDVQWEGVFDDLKRKMSGYYGRNFWEDDVSYVLKNDTCPAVPLFVNREDGTIEAVTV